MLASSCSIYEPGCVSRFTGFVFHFVVFGYASNGSHLCTISLRCSSLLFSCFVLLVVLGSCCVQFHGIAVGCSVLPAFNFRCVVLRSTRACLFLFVLLSFHVGSPREIAGLGLLGARATQAASRLQLLGLRVGLPEAVCQVNLFGAVCSERA